MSDERAIARERVEITCHELADAIANCRLDPNAYHALHGLGNCFYAKAVLPSAVAALDDLIALERAEAAVEALRTVTHIGTPHRTGIEHKGKFGACASCDRQAEAEVTLASIRERIGAAQA